MREEVKEERRENREYVIPMSGTVQRPKRRPGSNDQNPLFSKMSKARSSGKQANLNR